MRKTFKESLKGIRKIIFTSVFIFLIGLFFIDNKKLHATHTVTFHVNSSSYEVIYNLNDTIVEIPALTGRVFEGWYDNVNYTGTNYYGAVVSAATPTDLYALTYLEYNIDDFTVEAYGAGYKLTEYTGTNDMVSIPGYYYEEAGVTGLYEVKDILCVGSATFLNNNVPVYVSIPASVTLIEAGTFNNLPNLMMIYVDEDNSNYSSELEVLYNKSKTEIIHFPAQNYVENFEIPSTVTTIKKHAFYNTAYLKKVIIDGSVTTIENEAFIGNSVLETVVVNNGSLETIGAEAFKNNGNLKIAMIPNTVTFVGSNAYGGSNASLNIYYQDPVASIPGTWDTNWNMGGYAVVGEYDLINVTVTYKDDDDNSTILHTETVSFNNDATYNVTPTKASTPQYHYTFNSWTGGSLTNIVSDLTVTASYNSILRYYTVTFHDASGNVYAIESFPYGEDESNNDWYASEMYKAPDAQYTYEFSHWNPSLTNITSDVDTYPVFTETLRYYEVIFYEHDDTNFFSHDYLGYGTMINAPATNPTKSSTVQYTYTFAGWYTDVLRTIAFTPGTLTGTLNVYPKFTETLRTYKVEFYNDSVLYDEQNVVYGGDATAPATNPTKASTPQYHYTFTGWDKTFTNIQGYLRVNAVYSATLRSYTISFNSNGGSSVLPITQVYNTAVTKPADPTKTGHTFVNWCSDEHLLVDYEFTTMPAENVTLYAKWSANNYTISFNSNGGSLVSSITQAYGTTLTPPAAPTKTGHSFGGWYTEAALNNLYEFTTMPAENKTLYAKWTINSYTISFNSNGGTSVTAITENYNEAITQPADPTKTGHTFVGWYSNEDLTNAYTFPSTMPAENVTLYAKWNIISYAVHFYSTESGVTPKVVFETVYVEHGNNATVPEGAPTKASTLYFTYEFSEWSGNILNVTEEREIYPVFTEHTRTYAVRFYNESTLIVTRQVEYGEAAVAPDDPTKEPTNTLVYTFAGWDKAFDNITADLDVYATYTSSERKYEVKFYNESVLIVTRLVSYEGAATAPANPSKAATPEYTYTFDRWDKAFNYITSDLDVYALYDATPNSYTITFNTNGGSLIDGETHDYGEVISAPTPPTKNGYNFIDVYVYC